MRRSKRTEKKKPLKIVLDTNVLISGTLTPFNPPGQILLALAKPNFLKLLISKDIFNEYQNVLNRKKFNLNKTKINELLKHLKRISMIIAPKIKLHILEDIEDNKFLECAQEGEADYIITDDIKHFKSLKKYKTAKIIIPADFLNIIEVK